jgi:hypothetical protein
MLVSAWCERLQRTIAGIPWQRTFRPIHAAARPQKVLTMIAKPPVKDPATEAAIQAEVARLKAPNFDLTIRRRGSSSPNESTRRIRLRAS